MPDNPRITVYMPNHRAMRKVAEEDGIDFNGALFEKQFWDNACGKNPMLQDIIKRMYQGELSLKEATLQVLKYIRFSGIEKRVFFDALPLIAKDACGNSGWITDGNEYFSVELEKNLKKLRSIIDNIFTERREASEFFISIEGDDIYDYIDEFGNMNISSDYSYEEQAEIEDYIDLTVTRDECLDLIGSKDVKPGDILNFIIYKFVYFRGFTELYDVIDFCIVNAAEFVESPSLRKRLREFVKFIDMVQESRKQLDRILHGGECRWQDGIVDYYFEN